MIAYDLSVLSAWDIQKPLQEIASGTGSFGPSAEWRSWYHYLLGQLLTRGHESFVSSLLELFVTGFMSHYPNGVHSAPYRQFRDDALLTVGRCIMDSQCWNGTDIAIGMILHRSNNNPNGVWCWWDASGDFSASMFFCLKYLPESLLQGWLQSVLAIPSPHWRAQVLVWLVGAHDILTGRIKWPSELLIESRPSVGWDWSHCLRLELALSDDSGAQPMQSLLPESSRSLVLQLVGRHFSEDIYLEWLATISSIPYLWEEVAEIPSTFERLYVRAG